MNTHSTLRKVLAFFRRDVAIARSYRIAFALEILEAFFGVATFYYLSRFVSNEQLPLLCLRAAIILPLPWSVLLSSTISRCR